MRLINGKRVAAVLAASCMAFGGLLFSHSALAATGQIYVTPANISVQKGSNLTVGVYITPGTDVNAVPISLSYDPGKLTYQTTSYANSPFTTQVGADTTTPGKIYFTAVLLSGTVTAPQSFIANITFTAIASSGYDSLDLTGSSAANSGSPTDPALVGATVTFTSTCPAGQTGTPPNCTTPTPPAGGSGSGTGSTKPGPSGSSGSGSQGSVTAPAAGATSASGVKAAGTPVSVKAATVEFTQASLSLSSKTPTKVYVRYGLNGQLNVTTPESDFATSHTVTLDPAMLIPGENYTYVVFSTDQQGAVSQTSPRHFKTKGLEVTLGLFDKNHQPLRNKKVTLHSTPITAKTDRNGFVTFTDVAPGDHHVVYTAGKQTYDQTLTVANNIKTVGTKQIAAAQNFSVFYPFTQPASYLLFWALAGVVLLGGAGYWLVRAGKFNMQGFAHREPLLTGTQTVIVSSTTAPGQPNGSAVSSKLPISLERIPGPATPQPGSTVTPLSDTASKPDNEEKG